MRKSAITIYWKQGVASKSSAASTIIVLLPFKIFVDIKTLYSSNFQGDTDLCESNDGMDSDCSTSSCSGKQVVVGICAMAKKTQSKPMKEILTRLQEFEFIKMVIFQEDVILKVTFIFTFVYTYKRVYDPFYVNQDIVLSKNEFTCGRTLGTYVYCGTKVFPSQTQTVVFNSIMVKLLLRAWERNDC